MFTKTKTNRRRKQVVKKYGGNLNEKNHLFAYNIAREKVARLVKLRILEKSRIIKETNLSIKPNMDNINWEIYISRNFIIDAYIEKPVGNSEKVIGGKMAFKIGFMPEGFFPEQGFIFVKWTEQSIEFDINYALSIINTCWCEKCQRVRGIGCICSKHKMEIIDIGEITRSFEEIANDVRDALKHLGCNAKEIETGIQYALQQSTNEAPSFDNIFKNAMSAARPMKLK